MNPNKEIIMHVERRIRMITNRLALVDTRMWNEEKKALFQANRMESEDFDVPMIYRLRALETCESILREYDPSQTAL
jgi:hypothetical protein